MLGVASEKTTRSGRIELATAGATFEVPIDREGRQGTPRSAHSDVSVLGGLPVAVARIGLRCITKLPDDLLADPRAALRTQGSIGAASGLPFLGFRSLLWDQQAPGKPFLPWAPPESPLARRSGEIADRSVRPLNHGDILSPKLG